MTQTNYLAPPLRSKTYRRFDGETWQELPEAPRLDVMPARCVFCGNPALMRADDGNYLCRLCAAERGLL